MDGLRYSPDDPYYRLESSIHVSMFEHVRLVTGTSFFWTIFPISENISAFFPEIGKGLLLHFRGLCTLTNPFLAKKKRKNKKNEIGQLLCPISTKSSGRRLISQIPGKNCPENQQLPQNEWKTAKKDPYV